MSRPAEPGDPDDVQSPGYAGQPDHRRNHYVAAGELGDVGEQGEIHGPLVQLQRWPELPSNRSTTTAAQLATASRGGQTHSGHEYQHHPVNALVAETAKLLVR